MILTHAAHARTSRNIAILAGIYACFAAALIWLDASRVIIGFLALFTLPALWDIVTNRRSGFSLDDHRLSWFNGAKSQTIPVLQIEKVRFDTRLDLSVRVTLTLKTGSRLRPPHASLPPHEDLETALKSLGIATERHHFSLLS